MATLAPAGQHRTETYTALAKAALFSPPSATLPDGRRDLVGLTREEITDILAEIGEKPFRTKQLWHWIYFQGAVSFDQMLNVSKVMRAKLDAAFSLTLPEVMVKQVSVDGTRKWLIRMPPVDAKDKGAEIECVYIPESDRGTLCISSQVGCTLTCTFCHTGTQRLVRNLTSQEIVTSRRQC